MNSAICWTWTRIISWKAMRWKESTSKANSYLLSSPRLPEHDLAKRGAPPLRSLPHALFPLDLDNDLPLSPVTFTVAMGLGDLREGEAAVNRWFQLALSHEPGE